VLRAVLSGGDSAVIAVGSRGAGKSFSLFGVGGGGGGGDPGAGLLPQLCADLFLLQTQGDFATRLLGTAISVYDVDNDAVHDLLADIRGAAPSHAAAGGGGSPVAGARPWNVSAGARGPSLRLREVTGGRFVVDGVAAVPVRTYEDVAGLLVAADAARSAAGAPGGPGAHLVVELTVTLGANAGGDGNDGDGVTETRVLFVDTAATASTGHGHDTTSPSAASLSALGMYIAECAARPSGGSPFVHHREAALNRILHGLRAGRKSQLVVLACAAPAAADVEETAATLRFASSIRSHHTAH
jgi:hypothetical protein